MQCASNSNVIFVKKICHNFLKHIISKRPGVISIHILLHFFNKGSVFEDNFLSY